MIVGVDPGLKGAFALYDPQTHWIEVHDMPIMQAKKKKSINAAVTRDIITSAGAVDFAVIERVFSSPQMGVTSAFTFGESLGVIRGVLGGLQIPTTFVLPRKWKAHFTLLRADKNASRAKAIELFPRAAKNFARVKDEGRAEAALIALWGSRNGELRDAV